MAARPLPTGRQAFRSRSEGYVKFLSRATHWLDNAGIVTVADGEAVIFSLMPCGGLF
jgi:hypothetical protein